MDKEIKTLENKLALTKILNNIVERNDDKEKRDLIVRLTNFLLDLSEPDASFTLFAKRFGLGYTVINTSNPIDVRLCGLIKHLKECESTGGCKSMWISGLSAEEPFTAEEYAAELEKLKERDEQERKKYDYKPTKITVKADSSKYISEEVEDVSNDSSPNLSDTDDSLAESNEQLLESSTLENTSGYLPLQKNS
jgi:hypothetical protein